MPRSLPTLANLELSLPSPHILMVRMNRPAALNAFDSGLHNDMVDAMKWYEAEDDIWCCVLTGTGRAFSAGNDLVELSKIGRPEQQRRKRGLDELGFGGLTNRRGLNKPIIAAVNGIAMGGGMELAMACDIIIASDKSRFALPETRVGLSPGAGGAANLHRLIGYHNAMYLIMTAKHISSQEAKWYGLVQEVVPDDKLLETALSLAETIVGNSPDGVRASKAQARHGREVGWIRANLETNGLPETVAMMKGENAVEGPKAFAQKRKPDWRPLAPLPKL
ncbi:short chain enoyl-CoA hydratase [Gonapodya prolifera JEL478]|uniref:Short chain enoyl-CoA hydratase n=1 Tax=Gonapodya prolifera (strain JEL478) TaxID=1344416 RepID=A0A139AC19_GONPJ|nr:short chain enoyl-CoA hydratase [Gonapodya prolifera JEL478]|eukprot:KXS14320.1 short chain enoyl-CoA hydratase [Gonapodya prolifera JEL478]